MVDNVIAITAGSGTSVRTVTNAGVDSGAHQQVMTIADAAGNALGTPAAPFPVSAVADTATSGTMAALNASVAIATGGRASTAIELTGTWVGTVSFQGTSDPAGTSAATANWYAVNAPAPTVAVPGSMTATNGLFRVNSAGYTAVRVIMSAYTSGTATAWINAAAQSSMVTLAEPVPDPDTVVTGNLTTTDAVVAAPAGNGTLLTGTPTAGSSVQVASPGGDSAWDLQLTGTFGGGTVYFEASFDGGVNWINVNGRQTGVVNTVLSYSTTAAGLFRGNTSGTTHVRARIVGATSPSVAVVLRTASGVGAMFMNASIPAGTNTIGNTAAAGVTVTGTAGALNAAVDGTLDLLGYASARVGVSGTFTGTLTFEASVDGTNWYSRTMSTSGFTTTTTSSAALFYGDLGGRYFRARMSSYTSGTATVTIAYNAVGSPVTYPTVNINAIPTGSNVIGGVGIGGTTLSAFSTVSAASTNATSVKAAAGSLYEVTVSNPTATAAYFKLFNKASAPTVGTDIPIATYRLAATGSAGDTFTIDFGANGKRFTTGIAWAITGAAVATDATVTVAGIQVHGTYI